MKEIFLCLKVFHMLNRDAITGVGVLYPGKSAKGHSLTPRISAEMLNLLKMQYISAKK